MNITISTENRETFSEISNNFIDYYMADANGDFVKVYLYLVRLYSCGRPVSVSDIADYFRCTEKDVCRAIRYWISVDVLSFIYDTKGNISGIVLKNISAPDRGLELNNYSASFDNEEEEESSNNMLQLVERDKPVKRQKQVERINHIPEVDDIAGVTEERSKAPVKEKLDAAAINEKLEDENFRDLMLQAEAYFKRTPSQTDTDMLIYVYDDLGFEVDLIEYLLEYCATIGKTRPNYVQAVAVNWYERGISDRKAAKEYTDSFNSLYRMIFKELGITNRAVPTPAEMGYIKMWQNDFGYGEDIIGEACRRAIITRPNSATFAYVNGILDKWHNDNVKTLKDIEAADDRYEKSKKKSTGTEGRLGAFGNYKQSSTDEEWDELTKMYIKEVNRK
ncbi:MAG: DnaD domain protein [Eubacterium sp.]|nr:DnaD domain protein [Eubacterium sp.]MBR1674548.1 DnaD domain protein [Eubacterium sp.]